LGEILRDGLENKQTDAPEKRQQSDPGSTKIETRPTDRNPQQKPIEVMPNKTTIHIEKGWKLT
jgi:hypothetical protein